MAELQRFKIHAFSLGHPVYILADPANVVSPYKFIKKCIKEMNILLNICICGRLDPSTTLVDIKERHVNGVYQQ